MNPVRFTILTLSLLAAASTLFAAVDTACAQPASEKKACVAASTEGQTARDEGKLLDARQKLLLCARDECPSIVRKSCVDWLADVDERIPSVVVRVLDAYGADVTDAKLSIDNEPYDLDGRPITLDPGQHSLVVTTAEGTTTERKVLLTEKEKSRLVNVQFEAPQGVAVEGPAVGESGYDPVATRSRSDNSSFKVPVGVWVLGGVGVAGLASFAYFGLTASKDLKELEDECSPGCDADDADSGRRNAILADVSLGVGLAALAGGATWLILASRKGKSQKSGTSVSLAPTRTGVFGTITARY